MKPFEKIFLSFFGTTLFIISSYMILSNSSYLNPKIQPISSKNDFQQKLSYALHLAGLSPLNIRYRDFQNEIEFYLAYANQNSATRVILNTHQDPLNQVASLQNIFKEAKIRDKDIYFIDLSINHPYVTLKNN